MFFFIFQGAYDLSFTFIFLKKKLASDALFVDLVSGNWKVAKNSSQGFFPLRKLDFQPVLTQNMLYTLTNL
jgi:hypothetical protein